MGTDADLVADAARRVVAEHDPKTVPIQQFLGACFDAGLSWVHFPEGFGGLGVSRGLQAVADRILQGAGSPVPLGLNPMGYGMAAPTVREHAQTDDVRKQLLRPLATTEHIGRSIVCGPDPERHVDAIRAYFSAGFDEVYVHQVGPDQDRFLDFYRSEVIPEVLGARVGSR